MAKDRSFAAFMDCVLSQDELFHLDADYATGVRRRSLKDHQNPFEHFDDNEFLVRYRFTKATVQSLFEPLPLEDSVCNRGLPLPPILQLLIAMRFYGTGTFQVIAGDLVNVSQPTVCRVVEKISQLLARTLFKKLVKFPEAAEEFDATMRDFYQIGKFPGVTGCIDCTHVRIKRPGGPDGEVFRNRKGYFSINVQAITGPRLQFYDLVASWPGSVHDSRIFDNSRARVLYEHHRVPGVLLGDAGYACTTFLMTPLANPGAKDSPEGWYQAAHIRTRNSVERAFGVWKRRFPCLDMPLQHKPHRSAVIVTACAALHNLARMLNEPCPPDLTTPADPPQRQQRQRQHHVLPVTAAPVDSVNGTQMRKRIIARYFQ
ncbi:putative nuclease HARBI1 [Ornithodoros turicata]|uniref:putative nuclease HARBI1 n=1 Tax=Ornithodoros turicata TaxID=34597 RepID=UPI003138800E